MEREFLSGLDAWLRERFDSSEQSMSGPEAYKRIVCEYEKKLQKARSEKSKKKYQTTLEFLNSYMQQGMEQKRKLYSFCADISALDTGLSFHGDTYHLSNILTAFEKQLYRAKEELDPHEEELCTREEPSRCEEEQRNPMIAKEAVKNRYWEELRARENARIVAFEEQWCRAKEELGVREEELCARENSCFEEEQRYRMEADIARLEIAHRCYENERLCLMGPDPETTISKKEKEKCSACEIFFFDERELEKFIRQCGSAETFPELVYHYMDKKGMETKDVYQNANLSRQDFSRITKLGAKPKRETIYSVAIGLQATWEETTKLLSSVGYAFRKNSKFDVILQYCIKNKVYEVAKINTALDSYGQKTLAMNGPVKVTDDWTR